MILERFKTTLLVGLVTISLVQSYLLAYSTPNFERISQTDYVETEPNGTQAELADVIFPEEIILHFGKNTHTVLRPGDSFYSMIMNQLLKKRTFDGFRRTTVGVASMNWEAIRTEQKGIEVRFKEGVPISVLKNLIQIKEDVPVDNDLITRIWIYNAPGKDEVKTYFFTDSSSTIYEAVKADVTVADVENKVALGNFLPTYHSENGDYYLPDAAIPAIRIRQPYTMFTTDKLKRSLFVDPGLTRYLMERDGTQIYTDGKRGLQIQSDRHWLSYTDPAYSTDTRLDLKENFLSALQFVNQHGGWNGTYTYGKGNVRTAGTGPQILIFRQYLEGLPVINPHGEASGYIKLLVQRGTVSGYERSLLFPDLTKPQTKTEFSLIGGKELDDRIAAYPLKSQIVSVFPAYRSTVAEQTIDYMPEWAVELRDGTFDFIGR